MAHSPKNTKRTSLLVFAVLFRLATTQNTTSLNDLVTVSNTTKQTNTIDISTNHPNGNHSVLPTPTTLISLSIPLQNETGTTTEKPPDKSVILKAIMAPAVEHIPPDCSQRSKNHKQPKTSSTSRWRRCCPIGENLVLEDDESSQSCKPQTIDFTPEIISVALYHNCIEDLEQPVQLESEEGNPCDDGSIYSEKTGDQIVVIQDGSLLIMDSFSNQSYTVESKYCLASYDDGDIYAVVCLSSTENHLNRGQTILFTCFMIASIPCLCLVSYFHFAIKELRSVHGLSLGVMSTCMAIGLTLHVIAELSKIDKSAIGYVVQFFMLAYFYWVLCLCCNVVLHVWYYLPNKILITRTTRYMIFISYNVISFSVPFVMVLMTYFKGLPGMPSYFYQGYTESIRDSQRYFIPPVTFALIISFLLLVGAFFGFKQLESLKATYAAYNQVADVNETTTRIPRPIIIGDCLDQEGYQVIKKDAKCICCLFLITIITWIFEVVTFYSPGPDDVNAFMEIINASQGVLILMIFIIVRRRRNAICRWWHDRGSHEISPIPMKDLTQPKNITENGTEANS